MVVCECLIVM